MTNQEVGSKIREIRKMRGLTQTDLAEKVGISYQQIQKYEKGITQIKIERLEQITKALDANIIAFLQPGEPQIKETPPKKTQEIAEPDPDYSYMDIPKENIQILNKKELAFLKLFRRIENEKVRGGVLKILKGIMEVQQNRQV